MNIFPVMKYILGLGLFGLIYWFLDGMLTYFIDVNVHTAGTTFNLLHAGWTFGLIVYLIFGGIWTIKAYTEHTPGGYM